MYYIWCSLYNSNMNRLHSDANLFTYCCFFFLPLYSHRPAAHPVHPHALCAFPISFHVQHKPNAMRPTDGLCAFVLVMHRSSLCAQSGLDMAWMECVVCTRDQTKQTCKWFDTILCANGAPQPRLIHTTPNRTTLIVHLYCCLVSHAGIARSRHVNRDCILVQPAAAALASAQAVAAANRPNHSKIIAIKQWIFTRMLHRRKWQMLIGAVRWLVYIVFAVFVGRHVIGCCVWDSKNSKLAHLSMLRTAREVFYRWVCTIILYSYADWQNAIWVVIASVVMRRLIWSSSYDIQINIQKL